MGFIKWIKKELDSTAFHRRRDSAPPNITGNFDADITRDEAYIAKVAKFNEWRSNERNERQSLDPKTRILYQQPIKETDEENDDDNDYEFSSESFLNNNIQQNFDSSLNNNHTSPPKQFYRENSSPYNSFECKTSNHNCNIPRIDHATPKKNKKNCEKKNYKNMNPKILETSCPSSMYSAALPNITEKSSDSSDPRFTGSYKKIELNSSSFYNEKVLPNNVVLDRKVSAVKRTRYSPSYQNIVNKHGDIVEYALPFIDLDEFKDEEVVVEVHSKPEEIVNNNFQFLYDGAATSNQSLSQTTDSESPLNTFLERKKGKVVITDLDKSNDSAKIIEKKLEANICKELDTLERFSKTINIFKNESKEQTHNQTTFDLFQKSNTSLVICWPNEVNHRTGVLRSSFPTPLEFSSGFFRNANITLRKYSMNMEKSVQLSESASKRDFDVLSQIRHTDIVIMMAICFDRGLNQVSIILEPFDFTLNYFLHQMDKQLNLFHCISIVQQIAAAVLYLQECGFIHSNISSHCVLMRKFPYCAKLSCFELTTDNSGETKQEIENNYGKNSKRNNQDEYRLLPELSLLLRNQDKDLEIIYKKLSKHSPNLRKDTNENNDLNISQKYLPYSTEYRDKFSLHNYLAPELISTKMKFVYPKRSSDVYSLTLMLWETLNNCIPYVIFNKAELGKLYSINKAVLPNFDKERCQQFETIFEHGLDLQSSSRLTIQYLISLLEDVKNDLIKTSGLKTMFTQIEVEEPVPAPRKPVEVNDLRNQSQITKANDKEYFYENISDPHKRIENAITDENLKSVGLFSFSDVQEKSSELEMNILNDNHYVSIENLKCMQPKILQDDEPSSVIRTPKQRTNGEISSRFDRDNRLKSLKILDKIEAKKLQSPKKPKRSNKKPNEIKSPQKKALDSFSSLLSSSALEFNKFLSPKTSSKNEPIYERTSTLKKKKNNIDSNKKKSVKDLFDCREDDVLKSVDERFNFHKLDEDLNSIPESLNIRNILVTQEEEEPIITENNNKSKGYVFKIDTGSPLPNTPIARKNKIRRNAWLSNNVLKTQENVQEQEEEKSPKNKTVNLSIKINHIKRQSPVKEESPIESTSANLSTEISKCLSTNNFDSILPGFTSKFLEELESQTNSTPYKSMCGKISEESDNSDSDILSPMIVKPQPKRHQRAQTQSPEGKTVNHKINGNKSMGVVDELKRRFSRNVPDELSKAFIKRKERQINNSTFENSLWRKEKQRCDSMSFNGSRTENELRTSVRETVKKIEQCFGSVEQQSPIHKPIKSKLIPTKVPEENEANLSLTPKRSVLNVTLKPSPPTIRTQTLIKKTVLRESIVTGTEVNDKNPIENPTGSLGRTKLTTRVVLNLRKVTGRSSDFGGLFKKSSLNTGTLARHSFCGNDLLKSLEKFRKEQNFDSTEIVRKKQLTFVCCNCGTEMTPQDLRKAIPENSNDGTLQSLTKSTEDFYIDDDFCQDLGANMELVADSDDLLGSFDFDILTEEFYQHEIEREIEEI